VQSIRELDSTPAQAIADALEATVAGELTSEERIWADRIEQVRSAAAHDTSPVSIVDFGAGGGKDHRTADEMSAGIAKTITISQACRASKPPFWCLLLLKLVRTLKPGIGIELGTCLGISAAYQAAAQQLNGRGSFITLEGAPALADISEKHLQSLGLKNATVVPGRFSDTLESILTNNAPIDYAFIDGHHDERATIAYYEQFVPHLADEAVIVFDDISWSPGMERAWQRLENDANVELAINLRNVGICMVKRDAGGRKHRFALRMPA
jgi:predicted O-methyltransferase YrrM